MHTRTPPKKGPTHLTRLTAVLALALLTTGCGESPLTLADTPLEPDFAAVPAESGQPISGYLLVTGVLDRPNETVTPGGTTRYRGTVFVVGMFGDVEGEFTYVQTSNWNKSGNGALTGPVEGTASWNGLNGGVSAPSATVSINEFAFGGGFVLHGDGELAGHKIQMAIEGPLGCQSPCP